MKEQIHHKNNNPSNENNLVLPLQKRKLIYEFIGSPANYTIKFDGWVVDLFKMPLSFKKKYKLNIRAISSPRKPIGSIVMNVISIYKMVVEIINIQTGEAYDFDRVLAQAGEDNLSNFGQKLVAAISRHLDEIDGIEDDFNFMDFEKGYIDKTWLNHEPSEAELSEIIKNSRKNNPNYVTGKKMPKKRLTNAEKGKLELLAKIMEMRPNYDEELKIALRKDQKKQSRVKRRIEKKNSDEKK